MIRSRATGRRLEGEYSAPFTGLLLRFSLVSAATLAWQSTVTRKEMVVAGLHRWAGCYPSRRRSRQPWLQTAPDRCSSLSLGVQSRCRAGEAWNNSLPSKNRWPEHCDSSSRGGHQTEEGVISASVRPAGRPPSRSKTPATQGAVIISARPRLLPDHPCSRADGQIAGGELISAFFFLGPVTYDDEPPTLVHFG